MFIENDYSRRIKEARIHLAKPNKTIISHIDEHFNGGLSIKVGDINELEFSVHHFIEDPQTGKIVRNKHVDMIKEKMLLRVTMTGYEEWFIVDSINEDGEETDTFNVKAFSLGYELRNRQVNDVFDEDEPINATELFNKLLKPSLWKLKNVDPKFNAMYRGVSIDEGTNILDGVLTGVETYSAIIIWDTTKREISLVDVESHGSFRGMTVDYGKLLQSVTRSRETEEMVTRLRIEGDEGLSIEDVNPTGQRYIEDFSFYMYPFERDANRKVVKESAYMSNDLCHAILDHEQQIEAVTPSVKALIKKLNDKYDVYAKEDIALSELQLELDTILALLDVAQASEDAVHIAQRKAERNSKNAEIKAKEKIVDDLNDEIESLSDQINVLQDQVSHESNFTPELVDELKFFIIERTWRDDNHIDPTELYEDGVREFNKLKQPKIIIEATITNFLNVIEEQYYWDKLILGDLIKVKYPQMNIEYMAKIIELNFDLEENEIDIVIANTADLLDDDEKLIELLYSNKSATSIIESSRAKWDKVLRLEGDILSFITDGWDATKNKITAGVRNSIQIGNRGIIVTNPDFDNEMVIIQSGVVALSDDYGETWRTAISPKGVHADEIVGKIILGQKLYIENESGMLRFDEEGLTVTRHDEQVKTFLNATDGIKIKRKMEGSDEYEDVFYADVDGRLYARGLIIDDTSTLGGYTVDEILDSTGAIVTDDRIENKIPAKTNGLIATDVFETIILEWDYISTISIAYYEIHASKEMNFLPSASTLIHHGDTSGWNHKVKSDETWYYRVRAVNTHGIAGAYSDQATATTDPLMSDDIMFGSITAEHLKDLTITAEKLAEDLKNELAKPAIDYTDEEVERIKQEMVDALLEEVEGLIGYTNEEIERIKTELVNGLLKEVEDLISYTDQEVLKAKTELTDEVSGLVSGINTNIGSLTETTNNLKTRADDLNEIVVGHDGKLTGFRSEVDEIEGRLTTSITNIEKVDGKVTSNTNLIESTASGINAKIESFESAYATDKSGILSSIESNTSEINAMSDEIELRVTKEEFENLEIGGRNLASSNLITYSATSKNGYLYTLTKSGTSNPYIRVMGQTFEDNTHYVVTFKVKKISGIVNTMAGHQNAQSRDVKIYRDGVLIDNDSWSTGDKNYPDDTKTHEYRIHFRTVDDIMADTTPHWYIQPNRSAYGSNFELEIWDFQLEKGNKATDWSPAPEDALERITKAEADITINSESIALKAEKSELTNYVDKQAYNSKMGSLDVSIEGITGRVSKTESTANKNTGEISSAKEQIAKVDLKADGISASVSDISTDLTSAKKDIATLDLKADGISASVSSVETELGNLEIGGVNLFKGTDTPKHRSNSSTSSIEIEEDGEEFIRTTLDNVTGYSYHWGVNEFELSEFKYPQTYTISADIRVTKGSKFRFGGRSQAVGGNESFYPIYTGTGKWERLATTLSFTREYSDVLILWGGQSGSKIGDTIDIKRLQYERGNKGTAWDFSSKDVSSYADDVARRTALTKVRYIRDWLNGNDSNSSNHWNQIQAITTDSNGSKVNRALNKPVDSSRDISNGERITNGNTTSVSDYASIGGATDSPPAYVTVDLGDIYEDIDYLHIHHYWSSNRLYYGTKTEVSEDGKNWVTLFDSSKSGEYKETSEGFVIPVNQGRTSNNLSQAITSQEKRVTNTETTLGVHAGWINAKAESNSVYTKTQADNLLKNKVSTTVYENKVSALDLSINSITGRVSSTETNINSITGQISSIKSDVSKLDVKADGIVASVSSVRADLDGLEIGGRNLVVLKDILRGRYLIQATGELGSSSSHATTDFVSALPSSEYILSGRNIGVQQVRFVSYDANKKYISGSLYSGDRGKSQSYKTPAGTKYIRISADLVTKDPYEDWKLEKGNKATDWTPAPEDTDEAISSIEKNVASLNIKSDSIVASVSKVQSDLNGLDLGGDNLVPDGSFENGGFGWDIGSSRASIIQTESHSGYKSLRIQSGTGTTSVSMLNDIPVVAGSTYEVSAWYKTSSNANGTSGNNKLRIGNQTGGLVNGATIGFDGAKTSWTQIKGTFTVPAGTTALKISVVANHTAGTIYWDSITLRDITNVEDALDRIKSTEATLKIHAESIALKINSTSVYTKSQADSLLNAKLTTTVYNTKMSALDLSLNRITTRVSNTESAVSDASGKITSITSRVGTLEVSSTKIESSVSSIRADLDDLDASTGNLVKNPAITGSHTGWSNTKHLTSNTQTFEGVSTRVLAQTQMTSGQTQTYSSYFDIDPSKAYEVSMWVRKSSAVGIWYMGLNGVNASGATVGFTGANSAGTATSSNTNFYFVSGASAKSTWTKLVGYIMPAGTLPADMKRIGTSNSAIFNPSHRRIRARWLNWNNGTTNATMYVAMPKVVEVSSDSITRITQTSDAIELKVAKTDYTGNTLVSMINQTATSIKIKAENIDLIGDVTITNGTTKISSLAVGTASIANLAVTNGKIANLTVTGAKIANATIVNAKIADLAVSNAKIANATITNAKIANLTITGAKIANATITNANIANLSASKINTGTLKAIDIEGVNITGSKISGGSFEVTYDVGELLEMKNGQIASHSLSINKASAIMKSGGLQLWDFTVSSANPSMEITKNSIIAKSSRGITITADEINGDVNIYGKQINTISAIFKILYNLDVGGTSIFTGGVTAKNGINVGTNASTSEIRGGTSLRLLAKNGNFIAQGSSGYYAYLQSDIEARITNLNTGSSYMPIRASSHLNGSSIQYKSNHEKFTLEDAYYLLDNANVHKYHINTNLEGRIYDKPKIGMYSETIPSLLRDEDGVDTYSIVSTLWKIVQHQRDQIEELQRDREDIYNMIAVL